MLHGKMETSLPPRYLPLPAPSNNGRNRAGWFSKALHMDDNVILTLRGLPLNTTDILT